MDRPALGALAAAPILPLRRRAALPLPRVLLCDLDGTLVDTMPILADLAAEVMTGVYGIETHLARELYLTTCGLPFCEQLAVIWPGDPRNAAASRRFERRKPALCRGVRMPADTRRALSALRGRGVRVAVSSNNGTDNVEAFALASSFPFDLVLAFDGDGLCKGGPHIARAEQRFDVARGEMLFVGDSLHDGEIAEAAQIPFVGVAGTFSKERFALRFPGRPVLPRFSDIVGLFD